MVPGVIDTAIVGGGLAGLTAAILLAQAGQQVAVFEKSNEFGGRAPSYRHHGYTFNLGPHAFYLGGPGEQVLRKIGIDVSGGIPSTRGHVVAEGALHAFPAGLGSVVKTTLLSAMAKLECAVVLRRLSTIDARPLAGVGVGEWLNTEISHADLRRFLLALIRLTTYSGDLEQSASAALAQLQQAFHPVVRYLHGGWQVLVDALTAVASRIGVSLVPSARVMAVLHDRAVEGVRLADGREIAAKASVLAVDPWTACSLIDDSDLAWQVKAMIPVAVACLDLALTRLPRPESHFALATDEPLYFSVHSAVADLAPARAATVHVAKYLDRGATGPTDLNELEGLLDRVQPGWRELVVWRRFLPSMRAANALVTAPGRGLDGRPSTALRRIAGLYLAGDWVGPEGMLADATLGSAAEATEMIVGRANRSHSA